MGEATPPQREYGGKPRRDSRKPASVRQCASSTSLGRSFRLGAMVSAVVVDGH
jgi:hypothetical protein